MTINDDAKFEEKLTGQFKIDLKNLTSTQESKKPAL